MANVKWTQKQRQDIAAIISKGHSTPDIARKYGVTPHSIRALRDDMRLKANPNAVPRHQRLPATDDQRWGPDGIVAQSQAFVQALQRAGVVF